MYNDVYFPTPGNTTQQSTALQVQVDVVKKCMYVKILSPKSINNGWPTWDWMGGLVYSLNFNDIPNLLTELTSIMNGTSKEANTMRSYDNNSKAIAFGKSVTDNMFKVVIMNTLQDKSQVKSSFSFDNVEDFNKFLNLLSFISVQKQQFFMCEFIINAVTNGLKTEMYKMMKTDNNAGNSGGYNKSSGGYNKSGGGYTKSGGYNNQPQPQQFMDGDFGGNAPMPNANNFTPNVSTMVDNVMNDFGMMGGNTNGNNRPQQKKDPISDLL